MVRDDVHKITIKLCKLESVKQAKELTPVRFREKYYGFLQHNNKQADYEIMSSSVRIY